MMRIAILLLVAAAILSGAAMDQKDVEYGRAGGKSLLLDLHVPDGVGPFRAVILVHGGGFDEGSKSTNCRPLFEPLAEAGFAWQINDTYQIPRGRVEVSAGVRSELR